MSVFVTYTLIKRIFKKLARVFSYIKIGFGKNYWKLKLVSYLSLNTCKCFCCSDGAFQTCLSVVKSTLAGCSHAETEQLSAYHSYLETIREFSGVCEDHFAACVPMDAMTCSMETSEKMKTMMARNMTRDQERNLYCRYC